jgi:hypothetical protein
MVGPLSHRIALESQGRKFNAARYASLTILELEPSPSGPMPQSMGGGAQDLFSQAIMTQVGMLLKSNAKESPRFRQGIDNMVAQRWLQADYGDKLKTEEAKLAPQF